ncbi:efflux RND transporter periplasmic adaptor subunit [Polyangium aurulentum]|uniref:efflux RND transporter periplasmic adaptor subunit n=1 Tax=Polyangium aurulentum TaxID=2567896 RepID=UPI0010ADB835|nr:efflux RND transporter periplasmic adaptor subunit [Polyangium aurulentum]UQA63604.1 efflux RND transporter periplasmic adaptor subunit [Polyangium aurulentum]
MTTTLLQGRGRGFVLLLAIVGCLLAGCGKKEGGGAPAGGGPGKGKMTFPVEVANVASERVEYTVSAVGTVDAYERVQVTARVAGVVEKVRFSEGDAVKKGQVLVEIDPARYTLAARRAQASLERVQASAAEAQQNLDRRKDAGPEGAGVFSKEDIESWQTRSRTAVAQVSEAKAALDEANLNLRDAYVRAPIEGKMQTRTVQTGQFVQAGTVLGTVLRRDPLLLRFQVPEADAPRLQSGMAVRFRVGSDERTYSGKITLVAEAADENNRMVPIIAQVDDEHKDALRPGAFADVTVPVGVSDGAPVIPQTSIRPSERGFLAFVVKDGVASERVLTLGMRTADGRVEVRKGISPGETLVVRGAEPLREGMQVRVVPPGGMGPAPKEGGAPHAGGPDAGAPDGGPPSQGAGPPAKGGSAP